MAYKDGQSGAMKIAEGAARRGAAECTRATESGKSLVSGGMPVIGSELQSFITPE